MLTVETLLSWGQARSSDWVEFTTEGWREMKVGIFSKRDRGEPATPEDWDTQTLPAPKTRIAFAAIEDCDSFGRRWKAWHKRLGLVDTFAITVLADGAKWIWEEQRRHLCDADGVLDIYHMLQHVSELGKALHSDSQTLATWTDQARRTLLSQGGKGSRRLWRRQTNMDSDPSANPLPSSACWIISPRISTT